MGYSVLKMHVIIYYMSYILRIILESVQTVFSFKELSLICDKETSLSLAKKLNYYVKKGYLYSPCRGIYSKNENYNKFELANRLYSPSYISFESVLFQEGVVFQYNSDLTVASYLSRSIAIEANSISYRKLKEEILFNTNGIIQRDNYWIATKERALLDTLYLYKKYYFDNIIALDLLKLEEYLEIYKSNSLKRELFNLLKKK